MSPDRDIAFPVLTPEQIAALAARGQVRAVAEGEVLWSEGERDFGFFVVIRGRVEIIESSRGEARTVTIHEPGEFTGDVDLLTGRASLVSARSLEDGEVLALDTTSLKRVVGELPEISELLLKAFLTRRALLIEEGFVGLRIIGSRFSPEAHRLRDFASRNAIPFTWIDLEKDEQAEQLLRRFGVTAAETPIVIGRDGRWVSKPPVAELARCAGLPARPDPDELYDLIIVGAGPAGLAASVYAASEGLKTIAVDRVAAGGQAGTSSRIENYLGFPTGISGADLAHNALLQAHKFGGTISVPQCAAGLNCGGGQRTVVLEDGSSITGRCVLIASGVEYRRLPLPNLQRFEGAGVYYAASDMEARLCHGDEVVIVGGGNSAGQAATFLARAARRVHILIRGEDLGKSMSRYLVDRLQGTSNVVLHTRCEVVALEGDESLSAVRVRDRARESEFILPVRALFMFIGAVPHTEWLGDCVRLDRQGFVVTGTDLVADAQTEDAWRVAGRTPFFLETSLPGVFAAGDVRSGSVKRVASAVGEGSMAISFVHAHIGAAK